MGDLETLAKVYLAAANDATDRMIALGLRPDDPAAVGLWQMRLDRFYSQSTSLRRIGATLNDLDAQAQLDALADKLALIKKSTAKAEDTIKTIESIDAAMTKIAKLIALGSAIVTFVANPVGGVKAVITALTDLNKS